jgi:hypothetical protein
MIQKRYKVYVNLEMVASDMDIKTATLLIRMLFEEYYNESNMVITIREMERVETCDANG